MSFATTAGTLEDLGWAHVLLAVAERAQTPRGSEEATTLEFLDSRSAVESVWAHIEEARHLLGRELPMPLGGAPPPESAEHCTQTRWSVHHGRRH